MTFKKTPNQKQTLGRNSAFRILVSSSVFALMGSVAAADGLDAGQSQQIRAELDALRVEQQSTSDRIARLERMLAEATGEPLARLEPASLPSAPVPAAGLEEQSRLSFSGDARLRYEVNPENDAYEFRGREVIRGRLKSQYEISDNVKVGARLVTGSGDDPNTADVTLSNFLDDIEVNLDQIYMQASFGGFTLYGGKFPNPLLRTDLVWDGDVNPQGAAIGYTANVSDSFNLSAQSLYFVIEESSNGPDSEMLGVQGMVQAKPTPNLSFTGAAGYYDYTLSSLVTADAGDFRSNLIAPDGSYLSDFNLLNLTGVLTYDGLNEDWPLQVIADYVQNQDAATDGDTGFSLDLFAGRTTEPGNFRFGYGYAEAEVDAVLAAFSHDNTNIPTNYRQHSLYADYVISDNVTFNTTLYRYRPLDSAISPVPDIWQDRIRFNLVYAF